MHECTNAHTDCECKRLMCDACFEDAATKELRAGGWSVILCRKTWSRKGVSSSGAESTQFNLQFVRRPSSILGAIYL